MHPATAKKASGRFKETPARPAARASTGECRCPGRRFSRADNDANSTLRRPHRTTAPQRRALLQALLTSRDLGQPMARDEWFIIEAVLERALRILLAEVRRRSLRGPRPRLARTGASPGTYSAGRAGSSVLVSRRRRSGCRAEARQARCCFGEWWQSLIDEPLEPSQRRSLITRSDRLPRPDPWVGPPAHPDESSAVNESSMAIARLYPPFAYYLARQCRQSESDAGSGESTCVIWYLCGP
jgi:hypothetical protein